MTQKEARAINKIRSMAVVHNRVRWNRTHTAMIGFDYSENHYVMNKHYYYVNKDGNIVDYGVYCVQ